MSFNPGSSRLRLPSRLGAGSLLISACSLALVAFDASAQAVRPDAGSTLQQQGSQPPSTPRVSPQVLPSGHTPQPVLERLPSVSVAVKSFKFSGHTAFGADQLAEVVKEFAGKPQSLDGLNQAAAAVRQFYRERGYFLAQAYLPRQDITSGVIEITVLEGHVGQVRAKAAANARLRESFAQSVLDAHLKAGQVITEAALEKPLLILNDMAGTSVKSAIGPGTGVGSADMDVQVERSIPAGFLSRATDGFVTGSADLDNWGSRFTGQWRAGASASLNNITGYGDQLSVRGQVALENSRSNFTRIGWQTPVGYYGTRAGLSYSKLNYTLIKDFAALRAEGDAAVLSLFVSHPLVRTRNLNLSLTAGYDKKDIEDRTLSTGNIETRHLRLTRAGLSGDWRDSVLGGGLNAFGLHFINGDLSIDQAAAITFDQGATGPRSIGRFNKTTLDFQRLQHVTRQVSLLASVNAQFASKNLTSAEKLSLGGVSAVRAYPGGEATGDQGYTATLEARYANPAWSIAGAALVLTGFYDTGRITISREPVATAAATNSRSLQGAGFGVNLGRDGDFMLRSSIAWRVNGTLPTSDIDRSPRVWVQAVKWF